MGIVWIDTFMSIAMKNWEFGIHIEQHSTSGLLHVVNNLSSHMTHVHTQGEKNNTVTICQVCFIRSIYPRGIRRYINYGRNMLTIGG